VPEAYSPKGSKGGGGVGGVRDMAMLLLAKCWELSCLKHHFLILTSILHKSAQGILRQKFKIIRGFNNYIELKVSQQI